MVSHAVHLSALGFIHVVSFPVGGLRDRDGEPPACLEIPPDGRTQSRASIAAIRTLRGAGYCPALLDWEGTLAYYDFVDLRRLVSWSTLQIYSACEYFNMIQCLPRFVN